MAKRFTNTDKWKMAWFRKLGSQGRDLWFYLHDNCDLAGVMEFDPERISFELGFSVTLDAVKGILGDKVLVLGDDRIFLTRFVEFQYGELSESCHPHKKVIQRLKALGLWENDTGGSGRVVSRVLSTLQEEEEEEEQEEDKEEEEEEEEDGKLQPQTHRIDKGEIQACLDEWRTTLMHFEINRPIGQRDELAIARAVQSFGPEWVKLALMGARKQTKSARFDPKMYVSLSLYLHKDKIERLVNIGSGKESPDGIDWDYVFGRKKVAS